MSTEIFSDYFLELQTQTGWGRMLGSFARWCAPLPGQLVLDIGCGPGLLPAKFAEAGILAFGSDLDSQMFVKPVHQDLLVADLMAMPFVKNTFDFLTASNLIYLLPKPVEAMKIMMQLLKPGGQICMLNPSEKMSLAAAEALANETELTGVAYESLLNYGQRAEEKFRWSKGDLEEIYAEVGLTLTETTLKMGLGLIRFSRGVKIL